MPCNLADKLAKIILDEIAELGILTEGIVYVASQEAGRLMAREKGELREVLERLLSDLCLKDVAIERREDVLSVEVEGRSCSLCLGRETPRTEFCPLPGLLSSYISNSTEYRLLPVRWEDGRFVKREGKKCRLKFSVRRKKKDAQHMG